MATNGNVTHTDQFSGGPTATTSGGVAPSVDQTSTTSSNNNLGKDEVAWFFVEQYYTTLSKNPEKLHLFYSKRSQFVYGLEAEVANVSVGRPNIQERIKQLDFQDCKVRVSNVDSQASYDNIVIQVIGETSNKAGDPKKFVQTFVLAQQPSGYFVLNDILRYIDEEGDEEPAETAQEEQVEPATQAAPATKEEPEAQPAAPTEEPASFDAGAVDKKLEDVSATPEDSTPTNGDVAAETAASETPAAPELAKEPEAKTTAPEPEETTQEIVEEEIKEPEPEKPADPSPTPAQVRQPPATTTAAPAAPVPTQPPKPMTWASRVAAGAGPRPVVPLPTKPATPAAPAAPATAPQSRPAAPTQSATAQAPAPSQSSETATPATPSKETSTEWQTAGNDSKRQNRPQSISGPQTDKDGTMGYVKYVTEKVNKDELRASLAQHGELVYFDINRQKNCAFVEFATHAGYQAAVAANPHVIDGESIVVEPRRPKAGAYGGSNYNSGRGNLQNRPGGRGGFEGRSGSQGGRGNFGGQGRGRGGGGAPRGRGASQATNA